MSGNPNENKRHCVRIRVLTAAAVCFLVSPTAFAVPLTYSTRTRDYSAWTAATRGDINSIGMAGATLAVPSSIAAAEANSAGYAMQTGSVSAQINKVTLQDRSVQRSGEPFESSQWGLAVSPPPWGFGIAYYSPMTESGTYELPGKSASVSSEVSIKELRFTVARSFFDSRLALGFSLALEKAVREFGVDSYNGIGVGAHFGALYRLQDRVILGFRLAPEVNVAPTHHAVTVGGMDSFNRTVVVPASAGVGIGWVPNRFFKAGMSLNYIASTPNTALFADESIETGETATVIPRLGASYVLAEFRNFKMEAAVGSYYETARLAGLPDRLHATGGLEANPYFINTGIGYDVAQQYKNIMVSVGIDLVRTLRTFEIIPRDSVPPYDGFLPRAGQIAPDGLPHGLTQGEKRNYPETSVEDVGKIVSEIPGKFVEKLTPVIKKREPEIHVPKRGKWGSLEIFPTP